MDFLQVLSSGSSRSDIGAMSSRGAGFSDNSSKEGFFSVLNEELVGSLAKDKAKPKPEQKQDQTTILDRNSNRSTLRSQKTTSEAEEIEPAPEQVDIMVAAQIGEENQPLPDSQADSQAESGPGSDTDEIAQVPKSLETSETSKAPELVEEDRSTETEFGSEQVGLEQEVPEMESKAESIEPAILSDPEVSNELEVADELLAQTLESGPLSPKITVEKLMQTLMDEETVAADPELRKNLQELIQKMQQVLPKESTDAKLVLQLMQESLENGGEGLDEIVKLLETTAGFEIKEEISSELKKAIQNWQERNSDDSRKQTIENLDIEILEVSELSELSIAEDQLPKTDNSREKNLQDSLARLSLKIVSEQNSKSETIVVEKEQTMPEAVELVSNSQQNTQSQAKDSGANTQQNKDQSLWISLLSKLSQKGFSEELLQEITKEVKVDSEGNVRSIEQQVLSKGQVQGNLRHPGFVSSTRVMVQQVMDQIQRLAPPEVTKIRMVLRPEALGELRLELKQNQTGLEIKIEAQTQAVKEVLERNMFQLRESLKTSGLENAEIKISSRDEFAESFAQAKGQDADSKSGRGKHNRRNQTRDLASVETDSLEEMNRSTLQASGSRVNLSA